MSEREHFVALSENLVWVKLNWERVDSLEKTLMLGESGGRRRRGCRGKNWKKGDF